jgi:cell division FtsZ-interacting protein ZapD
MSHRQEIDMTADEHILEKAAEIADKIMEQTAKRTSLSRELQKQHMTLTAMIATPHLSKGPLI